MAELGTKHECSECGTKYYDLGNSKAECPNCDVRGDAEEAEESAGSPKQAAKSKTPKKSTRKKAGAKKTKKKK